MANTIKKFHKRESGATMVEYALIVALIAVAVAATVWMVGDAVDTKFNEVVTCVQNTDQENCGLGS